MESKEGDLLDAAIAKDGQWRFPPSDSLPKKFQACITSFEDKRFFYHPGFDPFAILRAMIGNFKKQRKISGGSTLTMQVIRLATQRKGRRIFDKLKEILMAIRLELTYSKNEILNLYASHAPFGGNVVGLEAACWRYFGRGPYTLSWAESAMLAVLPNAPSLIHPGKNREILLKKRNRLLDRLNELNIIDSLTTELAKEELLPLAPLPLPQITPHLFSLLIQKNKRQTRFKTNIKKELQQNTIAILERHQKTLRNNKINNAAALIIDVKNNTVITYVGNTKQTEAAAAHYVDIIQAPRSTGSILKPFLYAALMRDGDLLPKTLVTDIPVNIGGFSPQNYNTQHDGMLPSNVALAKSLNVPAVLLLRKYGNGKFHHILKMMGMTTLNHDANHYGLTLILGGAEGTLWDITNMYAGLARCVSSFEEDDLDRAIFRKASPQQDDEIESKSNNFSNPLDAASAYMVLKALLEVARPEEDQYWRSFSSSRKISWKTGTSYGYRDAWAVGCTPNYVVGVWVGNADGEGRPELVGARAAAPILFDIFNVLPAERWFEVPIPKLVRVPICRKSGYRVARYCNEIDTVLIPETGLRSPSCPFHFLVHLNADSTWRVHSECEDVSKMKHVPWFILPPTQEYYYKRKHADYSSLPPFRKNCVQSAGSFANAQNLSIDYPMQGAKIYVPIELDGSKGKAIFEASHRLRDVVVYWHLDDNYVGSTIGKHQMAFCPQPGKHVLTVLDEYGESHVSTFEILEK